MSKSTTLFCNIISEFWWQKLHECSSVLWCIMFHILKYLRSCNYLYALTVTKNIILRISHCSVVHVAILQLKCEHKSIMMCSLWWKKLAMSPGLPGSWISCKIELLPMGMKVSQTLRYWNSVSICYHFLCSS